MADLRARLKQKYNSLRNNASVSNLFTSTMSTVPTVGGPPSMERSTFGTSITTPGQAYKSFDPQATRKKKKKVAASNPFDYSTNLAREAERVKNLPVSEEEVLQPQKKTVLSKLSSNTKL